MSNLLNFQLSKGLFTPSEAKVQKIKVSASMIKE